MLITRDFIFIKNHQLEVLIEESIIFITATKNINCLSINKNVQGLYGKKTKTTTKLLKLPAVSKRKL